VKKWEAIGTKEVAFDIIVTAKNKAEAIEKIRRGDVDSFEFRYSRPGFALSGGGDTGVMEVVEGEERD